MVFVGLIFAGWLYCAAWRETKRSTNGVPMLDFEIWVWDENLKRYD